jgi:hypothetical protein
MELIVMWTGANISRMRYQVEHRARFKLFSARALLQTNSGIEVIMIRVEPYRLRCAHGGVTVLRLAVWPGTPFRARTPMV